MLAKFLSYISNEKLFSKDDPILLALSGGMDSMVMADLFLQSGREIGIAHVNFKLRGEESDGDEAFVSDYARMNGILFYCESYSGSNSASSENFQNDARKFRYRFFRDLCSRHNYSSIATAHHRDDAVETFLLHFMRGAGLSGLSGIKSKSHDIVRPLMHATREEISKYASDHQIAFREDSSNITEKYDRNIIRHGVLPQLIRVHPQNLRSAYHSIENISASDDLLCYLIEKNIDSWQSIEIGGKILDIGKIRDEGSYSLLHHLLSEEKFSRTQIKQMLEDHREPVIFYSGSHEVIIERGRLYVLTSEDRIQDIKINIGESKKLDYLHTLTIVPCSDAKITDESTIEYIDADAITESLIVRSWNEDDRFYPLGMKGQSKKVSEFLKAKKINPLQRRNVVLLTHKDDIVWVMGQRLDDRFKIKTGSHRFLQLRIVDES